MRRTPLVAVGLAVAGVACFAAAPLARSYTPPEPAAFTDPVSDAVPATESGPPGPDITAVAVSQPDPGEVRLVVTFAEPLDLRETAPVAEDGIRVMIGHHIGDVDFHSLAAWVGAADASRVLLTDLAEPWHPGSVDREAGSASVDGRTLTMTLNAEPLRARTRAGRPVDPGEPLALSVHTTLGWAANGPVDLGDTAVVGDAAPDADLMLFAWSEGAQDTTWSRGLTAAAAGLAAVAVALVLGPAGWAARRRRAEQRSQEAMEGPSPDEEFADVEMLSSSR